jgi:hypothetical protein
MKNTTTTPRTFDVIFNDANNTDRKGFAASADYCLQYVTAHNGTNDSYFADYSGGVVQVVCNEDGEVIHEERVI